MPHSLKELELTEISLVDNPANPGSKVVLVKRAATAVFAKAIKLVKASDPDWVARIIKDAKTFDEMLEINEDQQRINEATSELWDKMWTLNSTLHSIIEDGDLDSEAKAAAIQISIEQFQESIAESIPEITDAVDKAANPTTDPALSGVFHAGTPGSNEATKGSNPMADDKITKELGDLKTQIEKLTEGLESAKKATEAEKLRADTAEKLAKLSDVETAFYGKLADDDKPGFLDKSESDRALTIKRAAEGDEVLELHGESIRKSEVGVSVFNVMKAQAKESDAVRKQLDEERDANQLAAFTKRAETEFDMLPGEPVEKAKALLAINKVKDDDKTALEAMLKAGNEAMATLTKQAGSDALVVGSAGAKLEALAKEHANQHSVSYAKAYDTVIQTPVGKELYTQTLN